MNDTKIFNIEDLVAPTNSWITNDRKCTNALSFYNKSCGHVSMTWDGIFEQNLLHKNEHRTSKNPILTQRETCSISIIKPVILVNSDLFSHSLENTDESKPLPKDPASSIDFCEVKVNVIIDNDNEDEKGKEEKSPAKTVSNLSNLKKKRFRRSNYSRWGNKEDQSAFNLLRIILKSNGLTPSVFFLNPSPSPDVYNILMTIAQNTNWRHSPDALYARMAKLSLDQSFSVRQIKLLKRLVKRRVSKGLPIDYEQLFEQFPGKELGTFQEQINQFVDVNASIEN